MNLIFFPSYALSLEYSYALRNNSLKLYLNDDFVPGVCKDMKPLPSQGRYVKGQLQFQVICQL